jgi:hypothetical protein
MPCALEAEVEDDDEPAAPLGATCGLEKRDRVARVLAETELEAMVAGDAAGLSAALAPFAARTNAASSRACVTRLASLQKKNSRKQDRPTDLSF